MHGRNNRRSGFHRNHTGKSYPDLREILHNHLPVVGIKKTVNELMASTVRHNRARGAHSVQGMSSMVYKMLEGGWGDVEICNHLGMGAEELLRLKHITGFSKLFEDKKYSAAWKTKNQILLEKSEGMLKIAK